jgi:hypothetical protein
VKRFSAPRIPRLLGAAAFSATAFAGCTPKPPANAIADLVGRCVQAMVSNTCRVMQGAGQSLVQPGVETIFVAGIGPIDAKLYASLRESGQAMCDNVRRVCEQDWQGNACKTAQALYPEAAKKP